MIKLRREIKSEKCEVVDIRDDKEAELDDFAWEHDVDSRKIRVSHSYGNTISFEEPWFTTGDVIKGSSGYSEELVLGKQIGHLIFEYTYKVGIPGTLPGNDLFYKKY